MINIYICNAFPVFVLDYFLIYHYHFTVALQKDLGMKVNVYCTFMCDFGRASLRQATPISQGSSFHSM